MKTLDGRVALVTGGETKLAMIARTPLGRPGQPSDVADTVAFLASNDARRITGEVIETAGGINP